MNRLCKILPAAFLSVFIETFAVAREYPADLNPQIKSNRAIDSVSFVARKDPDIYDILVTVSTRNFTKRALDLSSAVHLLVNRSPAKGGYKLVNINSLASKSVKSSKTAQSRQPQICQQSFSPFGSFATTLAAPSCTCGFGCNGLGVCDDPDGDGICHCNQPAKVIRLENISIASGDEVTVVVLPRDTAQPELIQADDSRTFIFRKELASP